MPRISLLEQAHRQIEQRLRPGDLAVDATVGNGHDTLFLARCVGDSGQVFGFDLQDQALENTRQKLSASGYEQVVTLWLKDHATLAETLPAASVGQIAAVMFNLGYLPGSDKSLATQPDSTIAALNAACRVLAAGGLLTVIAYPGHRGGEQETEAVALWMQRLETAWFRWTRVAVDPRNAAAPVLYIVEKNAADELSAL